MVYDLVSYKGWKIGSLEIILDTGFTFIKMLNKQGCLDSGLPDGWLKHIGALAQNKL